MLLCGSLLELMAVGEIALVEMQSGEHLKTERRKKQGKREYDKIRNDRCDSFLEYV